MRARSIAGAALFMFVMALLPCAAMARVLNFSGPGVCTDASSGNGTVMACTNDAYIAQSYGDIAGMVDVRYAAPRLSDTSLQWQDTGFNNLQGVARAAGSEDNSMGRVDLVPLNGMAIALTHFDLGAFPNTFRHTEIWIYDLNGNLLAGLFGSVVGNERDNLPSSFNGNWFSPSGIRIEWADSAHSVGIDNITYNFAAVPEPSAYMRFAFGLAALALLMRRRPGQVFRVNSVKEALPEASLASGSA